MSIPFKSPIPKHRVQYAENSAAIEELFAKRDVPARSDSTLLMASWNVANLGAQGRTNNALKLIADIMKRFELIAVQEVNEEYRTLKKVVSLMGSQFDYIMTDTAGNTERLAFVYDTNKVEALNLFGELALRRSEYPKRNVRVRYKQGGVEREQLFEKMKFVPFDRNPFIGTFRAGKIAFTLVNSHLYFGKFGNSTRESDRKKYARRVLEIYALSKWADRRKNRKATYDRDIILTGDMNVPAMTKADSAFDALTQFGFKPVDYTSKVGGSNLGNDKTYDQMVFAPGTIYDRIKHNGVFDFDNAIFKSLWAKLAQRHSKSKAISEFAKHVKHHISDHRPLWAELRIK
jgi:hypothetical protein